MLEYLSSFSAVKTLPVLAGVGVLAVLDLSARATGRKTRYMFGVIVGTALSVGLMMAAGAILSRETMHSGYMVAFGLLLIVILWRYLFGTWDSVTKATVLGTFVFWIILRTLVNEAPPERIAHLLAILAAAIPAVVWCALFLPYHRERMSIVLTMFFAGMLSTVPILFYDAMVRGGVDLQFFLFRVQPQSFSQSAQSFVAGQWPGIGSLQLSIGAMLVSFLIVGILEEGSKFWVLKRAGSSFITSVDDMMQMAIIVAIGFAFAENITNSGYFLGFVKEYLLDPERRDWMGFTGNVVGRSVLTSMVHIVSTGVLGYFAGLAIFAGPHLQEHKSRGVRHRVIEYLHRLFGMRRTEVFRRQMVLAGFTCAVVLHAMSNFLVTLPDVLPGNPRTLGDLLQAGEASPLNYVALLLFPTLFYVVGGFYLLTSLFAHKENMKERGHLIVVDTFVTDQSEV